jgi:hypothetical protein
MKRLQEEDVDESLRILNFNNIEERGLRTV